MMRYRLGDVVWFGSGNRAARAAARSMLDYHLSLYPDSIAGRLVDAIYKHETDITRSEVLQIAAALVKAFDPSIQPSQHELVIHLRLGDVIEKSVFSVKEHLQEALMAHATGISQQVYVQPLSYYEEIRKQYKDRDIRQVTLVTGGCPPFQDKSHEYLNAISEWWTERGKPVVIRTVQPEMHRASDADSDFVYLCRARNFVRSGGGFTNLVAAVRTYM